MHYALYWQGGLNYEIEKKLLIMFIITQSYFFLAQIYKH